MVRVFFVLQKVTLWFNIDKPDMMAHRDRFIALCKRKGVPGVAKRDGRYWTVQTRPKNVTEDRQLLSAWSAMTTEVTESSGGPTRSLFRKRK